MTTYINTRNQEQVTLIEKKANLVVVEDAQGTQHKVTTGNFQRWYKTPEQIEAAEAKKSTKAAPKAKAVKAEKPELPTEVKEITEADTKEKPAKKKVGKPKIAGNHTLVDYLKELTSGAKLELFESTNANFKAVKSDKHYVMPFTFNTKCVVLWVKEAVLADIKVTAKHASHTYDKRISFYEDNAEARKQIKQIFDSAVNFFNETQSAAAAKKAARAEQKAKEKAEKAAKAPAKKVNKPGKLVTKKPAVLAK